MIALRHGCALVLCAWFVSAPAAAQSTTITLKHPVPLLLGQNRFTVEVKDARKRAIPGAEVAVALVMPASPAINHPEMRSDAVLRAAERGQYSGIVMITMAGRWTAEISVRKSGKVIARKRVTLQAQERLSPK